jgi:transcription elongation factor Elf1
MARQPKKTNSKEYFECPKCKSTFLDVTYIRDSNQKIIDTEYDCRECGSSWNSRGEEL